MLPENLKPFAEKPIQVLDDGHVLLVDVLGDEATIANAARVSYGAGTRKVSEDRHLIRYLLRQRHTSPFEMCEIILRIRVPMDAWKQWIRHRTASVNEYSTRYSEAINACQKTDEDHWRSQATDNKQGSKGLVTHWAEGFTETLPAGVFRPETTERGQEGAWIGKDYYSSPGVYLSEREKEIQCLAREVYEERLRLGVAREQARKDLPLSNYTEAYWKLDLHNLLHFLSLRLDHHAQKEIRDYANAIAEIVKVWVPNVWEAFEDYRLQAVTFSRMEVAGLKHLLEAYIACADEHRVENPRETALSEILVASNLPEGREINDFLAKLEALLG